MISTAPASQSIRSGASSKMGYVLTVQSLVQTWGPRELPMLPHPIAQFATIAPRQCEAWARFPLATGEPGLLGPLTPNNHSVT